jgi:hypothetical protein
MWVALPNPVVGALVELLAVMIPSVTFRFVLEQHFVINCGCKMLHNLLYSVQSGSLPAHAFTREIKRPIPAWGFNSLWSRAACRRLY